MWVTLAEKVIPVDPMIRAADLAGKPSASGHR